MRHCIEQHYITLHYTALQCSTRADRRVYSMYSRELGDTRFFLNYNNAAHSDLSWTPVGYLNAKHPPAPPQSVTATERSTFYTFTGAFYIDYLLTYLLNHTSRSSSASDYHWHAYASAVCSLISLFYYRSSQPINYHAIARSVRLPVACCWRLRFLRYLTVISRMSAFSSLL